MIQLMNWLEKYR